VLTPMWKCDHCENVEAVNEMVEIYMDENDSYLNLCSACFEQFNKSDKKIKDVKLDIKLKFLNF
jgi:hypothetical protein